MAEKDSLIAALERQRRVRDAAKQVGQQVQQEKEQPGPAAPKV